MRDHRRGPGHAVSAGPQQAAQDAGPQQGRDRADEAKVGEMMCSVLYLPQHQHKDASLKDKDFHHNAMMVIPHSDNQLLIGVLVSPCHSVVTRIYLRCHQQSPEAFRESRPSLSIITLVIIFTILFFNFFVKLCGELHQNVTQQSRKKLNCCCFGKI